MEAAPRRPNPTSDGPRRTRTRPAARLIRPAPARPTSASGSTVPRKSWPPRRIACLTARPTSPRSVTTTTAPCASGMKACHVRPDPPAVRGRPGGLREGADAALAPLQQNSDAYRTAKANADRARQDVAAAEDESQKTLKQTDAFRRSEQAVQGCGRRVRSLRQKSPPDAPKSPEVAQAERDAADAQDRLADLQKQFVDEDPKVKAAREAAAPRRRNSKDPGGFRAADPAGPGGRAGEGGAGPRAARLRRRRGGPAGGRGAFCGGGRGG